VESEILSRLLALAPEFENLNIHGVKAEFTRKVARILDGAEAVQNSDIEL
jgi:hypothetical protein